MRFTLRELTDRLKDPRTVAIWLTAASVCVIAAPFGTDDMSLGPRATYWFVSTAAAIALSFAIIPTAYEAPVLARLPRLARGVFGSLIFSAVYSGLLVGAESLVFTNPGFPDLPLMFGYVTSIAIAITIVSHLFAEREIAAAANGAPSSPRFLKRLKPGLGRNVIRLAMQDHYVEAVTDRGAQLILMRFADALEELKGIDGWRVHRSHWVADSAITDITRAGGKAVIIASDGAEIPVSRTYLPALREAGVLKRFS